MLRISFALGNLAARQEEFRSNYMSIDEHLSTVTQIYEHFLMLASEVEFILIYCLIQEIYSEGL